MGQRRTSRQPAAAQRLVAGAAAARHRRFPAYDRAAVRWPRKIGSRAGSGDEGRQANPAGRAEECRAGRPVRRRHLPRRHGVYDPAAAEAARRHGEGAGGGRPAGQDHRLQGDRRLFRGVRRADARQGRRREGTGGARPHGGVPVRAVHQAEQEDRAGGAGLAQPDRGAVEARRHGGQPPEPEDRREAGTAGDRQASASGWSACSGTWSPKSACCRWKSASATASSGRWRRRSASTT